MNISSETMKVVIISRSDDTGGAAIVSLRLMDALRARGVDARMLVCEKRTDSPFVVRAASGRRIRQAFLAERLKIFLANGLNRSTLFQIDTAEEGLPLFRHPLVKEADVVCLAWVNQGMLSLKGVRKLVETGKPIVWTMHDEWNFTGICHHAFDCRRFERCCGDCPLLGAKASPADLSEKTWRRKKRVVDLRGIHYVAVSNWLKGESARSSLLSGQPVSVIPNPFDLSLRPERRPHVGKTVLLFGAARVDAPIKGLPVLAEATRILAGRHPEEAASMELLTFGDVKDAASLTRFGISHRHLGRISGAEALAEVYAGADLLVSPSLFENLPGTLVEAQAYGCVPVAFLRGGQGDIIDDGATGVLVGYPDDDAKAAEAFAEGIRRGIRLSADPGVRERMRRSVEERFSAASVAGRYISLFNDLLTL